MKIIILATKNKGKIKEYNAALNPLGFTCVSLLDLKYEKEIIENGKTFIENAKIKAKAIGEEFNALTIADDSGLVVDALPGELGINSKRFSEEQTAEANNKLLLKKMKNQKNRNAHFVCALVLYNPKKGYFTFEGRVDGIIKENLKGNKGFGYDPLFFLPSKGLRMAELSEAEKNEISHRGVALKKLVLAIEENHEIIDIQ